MTWQIFTTIFDVAWLIALLVLLYLIWRSSEARLKHVLVLEKALLDVSAKDAESARKAVDAVYVLVDLMQKGPTK